MFPVRQIGFASFGRVPVRRTGGTILGVLDIVGAHVDDSIGLRVCRHIDNKSDRFCIQRAGMRDGETAFQRSGNGDKQVILSLDGYCLVA